METEMANSNEMVNIDKNTWALLVNYGPIAWVCNFS